LDKAHIDNKHPVSCCIVPSIECFLKCKMCYLWKSRPEPDRIRLNEWESFIDSLDTTLSDRRELIFSGGEPLLNQDMAHLIDYGDKRGLKTTLSTNAFLIDEDRAKQMIEAGLKEIYISLDSFNEETHDFLRGVEGSHKKAIDAIDYLSRYRCGLKINIITVISQCNLHEITKLVKEMRAGKKIDGIYLQAVSQPFYTPFDEYWYKKEEYNFLWPADSSGVNIIIDELINLKRQNYPIINHVRHLEKFKSYFSNPDTYATKSRCYLGDYTININPAGDVFLCCFMDPIGNIRKDNINEIWFSEKAQQKRKEMYQCRRNCHNMVNCFFMEKEE